jgi:hypothetical protein
MIKKTYKVGDTVWIYGIDQRNTKSYKGTVIQIVTINYDGYNDEPRYIIEIPTEIEPLLELRTWYNISQDAKGPVGGLREAVQDMTTAKKIMAQGGLVMQDLEDDDEEDIDPAIIHAALEKSQTDVMHKPLNLKTEKKPRRKYFKKKLNA